MRELEIRILEILEKIKPQNSQYYVAEYINIPLTGTKINFDAIDMVYLFLEIEKTFNIVFSKEDVMNYKKFNTIAGLIDLVRQKTEL